jgi:transcription elongation factor Elf1
MSATATAPVAPIAPTRGVTLPCPKCGEESASITFNLADGETFVCGDCEADFTADDVRNLITKWQKVLTWVDALPTE